MSKYQGRVDPLELLRAAYAEDKKVKLKDKQLLFEKEIRLPLSQPTAWLSTKTQKQYTLGSLWLYLQYHLKRISDYMNKITEYGVENVTISDRDEITNYFLGKISDSECINKEIKLQLSMKNNPQRAQPVSGFEEVNDPSKKVKTEINSLPIDLQVIDFINKFQRPTSSKTRSLRCGHKSFEALLNLFKTTTEPDRPVSQDDKKMRINTFMEQKKNPIIIVPEHLQPGNLSIGNIEKFLVGGEYSQTEADVGYKRWLEIQYSFRGKNVKFDVTNSPSILRLEDWKYVVAVFVQGRKNEFAGWAVKQPTELFSRTKGFHLKFSTKQSGQAQNWNVKVFTLDKNVRYRDSDVKNTIWKEIENYLYQKI